MKRNLLSLTLLSVCLYVWAWTSPVTVPDVGNARLRVVGQNALNYLTDFTASNSSCSSQTEFDTKTNKMANAFLALQADIIALCEVEENDYVLGYLCDELNNLYGSEVYTFITDGMSASQSQSGYMPVKAGFVYRKDKVTPKGASSSPYTSGTYKPRMRIQAFKENATGEMFVLSMNHFKAKDSSEDAGESTRLTNVSRLLTALNKITTDPDILVLGDLNCYPGEEPLNKLIEAGYIELLLKYDSKAYSYIYKGSKGLLDHALGNEPMSEQVTSAKVYHINTSGSYSYKYSDHDAYVVGLNLGTALGVDGTMMQPVARKVLRNGTLYIEMNGQVYDSMGRLVTGY